MVNDFLQRQQAVIFIIGWIAYGSTYLLRKPIGVVKSDLAIDLTLTTSQLGWLDMALLLPYAIVQLCFGSYGDKYGARTTLTVCLISAAAAMVSFGRWSSLSLLLFLLFVNGASQALCWPSCVKAVTAWFPDSRVNSVIGVYGTCAFAGGIAGTALTVYLQKVGGWRSAFFVPSVIVAALSLVVFAFFKSPQELNVTVPGKGVQTTDRPGDASPVSMLQLLQTPIIPQVAFSVFCLKSVRYCMYMWLPMYLYGHLYYTKTQAGMFSTVFEIGGVIGSSTIGFVIDRCFKGNAVRGSAVSFFLSAVTLGLFAATSSWGIAVNMLFLALAGGFNCGPDSILGGSVPSEIGRRDGRDLSASTVGFVNGFGGVGTFLEGPVVGYIAEAYGWQGMLYAMTALSLLGTASAWSASLLYASLRSSETLP